MALHFSVMLHICTHLNTDVGIVMSPQNLFTPTKRGFYHLSSFPLLGLLLHFRRCLHHPRRSSLFLEFFIKKIKKFKEKDTYLPKSVNSQK